MHRSIDWPAVTAYEDHRRPPVPWAGLLLRLFLVILPAVVLGVLLGGALVTGLGVADSLSNLILVTAGLLAGLGVGMLVTPVPGRLVTYLLTSAAFGLVVVVAMLILSQLARPAGTPRLVLRPAAVVGPLLMLAVQTMITWGLWRVRLRP